MKIIPLFILILQELVIKINSIAHPNAGNSSLWLPISSCTLHYSSINSTVTFFNCAYSSSSSSDWSLCFQRCCSATSTAYPSPSIPALSYCEGINQEQDTGMTLIGIAFIVVLCLFAGCFIICTLCLCCKFHNIRPTVNDGLEQQQEEVKEVQWREESQINTVFEGKEAVQWSARAKSRKQIKNMDEPCTICLQTNKTAKLYCGHSYHPHCIGQWLKKSKVCPYCRRDDIRGIKVYCGMCKWMYYVCTRTVVSKSSSELPLKCGSCQKISSSVLQNSLEELEHQGSVLVINSTSHLGQKQRKD